MQPSCTRCDLAGQIARCGSTLASITEVPPSRHGWDDIAVCNRESCGRQFMFTRTRQ